MIAIIDYGMGNLKSVQKAFDYLGAKTKLCFKGSEISKSTKVILPGVGAFGDAMKEIKARGFIEPLRDMVSKKNTKIMGVCLGLQLFFESSEESPRIKGLGLLKGKVIRFRSKTEKIPHMGWNDLIINQKHPMLHNVTSGQYFYFVHSYFAKPKAKSAALACCNYGKETFAAVVGNENLFATQFHPEKSQDVGLRILKNFIDWK